MSALPPALLRYAGHQTPGAAVAVFQRGRTLARHCVGVEDIRTRSPIGPASNFRLASVTKQLTAALILGFIDARALDYDTPVRSILPELPAYAQAVTVQHLLQHTSGLPDYEDLVPEQQTDPIDDADVLALLQEATLLFFAPGTDFRYSNTGYVLLGLIAARLTGRPLPEVFAERLFRPLGMARTVALVAEQNTVPQRAYGHTLKDGLARSTDQSLTSATLGDGGIYSSLEDLARWCSALDEERVPGWPAVQRMFEPLRLPNSFVSPYGMGWESRRWHGLQVHSHSGSTMGFRNALARFPDHGLSVVVLTNRSNTLPAELMDALLAAHLPGWKSSAESFLLCQQIVGLRPMDRHARPHRESGHAP